MTEIKTTEQEQKQEQKETNKELDYYRRITGLAQRASYGIRRVI